MWFWPFNNSPDWNRRQSQATPFASPYWFDAGSVRLNDSWRAFLIENAGIVQAFAERHFALYLQARNPNVPGVVNKLHAPSERQLRTAHQFWRLVREDFEKTGKLERFQDIYSERPLGTNFTIDHFLPWSFVVTQVVGKSMEPTIRDGAYCVFRTGVSGTRHSRILLVQKRDFTDPETGGGYTVKRYESTKSMADDGWRNERIRLVPDNPDRGVFPVLEFTPEDEADLRVIAEFVQMLNTPD